MMRTSLGRVFVVLALGSYLTALCLACSSPGKVGEGEGGNRSGSGGSGAGGVSINLSAVGGISGAVGGASGMGGIVGDAGNTGLAEGICGDTVITPNKAPVDVLLVLDRSDSMGWSMSDDCYCRSWPSSDRLGSLCDPQPANCIDRWSVVSTAVSETIAATPALNWGLELFSAPNSPSCSVALDPQVEIDPNAGPRIQSLLSSMDLQLWTPTALAVNIASLYLQRVPDLNNKAILLATDGQPNCKGGRSDATEDMEATTAAVASAASVGFPVYVVGIGPTGALANLDELAVAGGTEHYYPADSSQALADALAAIAKIIETTCEYQTPTLPPDVEKVYVYVDKKLIEKSDVNGWTFGASPSDIILTGTYCADLKAGITSTVQIIFGCEDYIPPAVIP